MERLVVRTFEEEEYHTFFKGYIPDPMMDAPPFFYNHEQISRIVHVNSESSFRTTASKTKESGQRLSVN